MRVRGNAVSGIFARGVQTAIQRCQPGDGWLGACAGPLVSHQERGNVAPRVLRGRNTSEFGFIFAKNTDFFTVCMKRGSSGSSSSSAGAGLPEASRCERLHFLRLPLPLYPPSSPSSFLNITGRDRQASHCTSFLKLSRITTISSRIITVNNPSH